jgi:hypothetical protein
MARLSERLWTSIWNTTKSDALLEKAAKIVNEVAKGDFHRDQVRTEPFTKLVKAACVKG